MCAKEGNKKDENAPRGQEGGLDSLSFIHQSLIVFLPSQDPMLGTREARLPDLLCPGWRPESSWEDQ